MGASVNGKRLLSKRSPAGSNPAAPANKKQP